MKVWYMNGAGNSFSVIDARYENIDMSRTARELCSLRGCDGFMALENSLIADFKLNFYNDDGSRAEMCGNGARCICRFAYENGIAGRKMTIETDAGIVEGERVSERIYRVRLNDPQMITVDKKMGVDYAVVGVPHAVIELEDLEWDNVDGLFERAREIRYELDANVNFYSRIDADTVKILTYERGVENFTLACGTGSGALAAILWNKGALVGREMTVKNRGGDLKLIIEAEKDMISSLYLEGDTEIEEIKSFR